LKEILKGGSQVNSTSLADNSFNEELQETSSIDFLSENIESNRAKQNPLRKKIAYVMAVPFALATISSATSIKEVPWVVEKVRRDSVMTVSTYQEIVRRHVSRAEALRISRQILENAEQERLELADREAGHEAVWENI
jgi:hypothetical protein